MSFRSFSSGAASASVKAAVKDAPPVPGDAKAGAAKPAQAAAGVEPQAASEKP